MALPRRTVLRGALAAPALAVPLLSAGSATAGRAGRGAPVTGDRRAAERRIDYTGWLGTALRSGTLDGASYVDGSVRFAKATGTRQQGGQTYDTATWTSPWTAPGFAFTRLIASWNARTPGASFVEIRVRGRRGTGTPTSYDVLGRWAASDRYLKRTSVSGQSDDGTSVNVDTWETPGLDAWQLQVVLLRRRGSTAAPSISSVGAVSSALPASAGATSKPGVARGVVLDVPQFSQMIHTGDYPQWNGGGEAWCSPTSTSMVIGYYGMLPRKKAIAFAPKGHPDPWVDWAARMTFDYAYDGTGNWPFNTAYAASLTGHAFVTRLRSLHEAERFIKAGIPLVASISFGPGELGGAPITSTDGHLTVIVGFTADGDPVVNDPAAHTDSTVRHTYDRAQYERAWLDGSGGTVYVIHDVDHPLPVGAQTNW